MEGLRVSEKSVGEYVAVQQIGSGSFSVVWKGVHKQRGEEVAIKEVPTEKLSGKLQESLESEISILRNANHPNIVRLLDILKTPERIFLIMEFCAGGDLSSYIRKKGPVDELTAQHFMRQLGSGLQVLRANNLIHRDLKPQNLLLSEKSPAASIKIADFGFARSLQPQGLAETLCGSPLYMAPEILQCQKYDAKADLWSVGAILFELVVGRPPFGGQNHVHLLQNIKKHEAVVPKDVADRLSISCMGLIRALLKRNPVERLSFEEFFNHPFLGLSSLSLSSLSLVGEPAPTRGSRPLGVAAPGAGADVEGLKKAAAAEEVFFQPRAGEGAEAGSAEEGHGVGGRRGGVQGGDLGATHVHGDKPTLTEPAAAAVAAAAAGVGVGSGQQRGEERCRAEALGEEASRRLAQMRPLSGKDGREGRGGRGEQEGREGRGGRGEEGPAPPWAGSSGGVQGKPESQNPSSSGSAQDSMEMLEREYVVVEAPSETASPQRLFHMSPSPSSSPSRGHRPAGALDPSSSPQHYYYRASPSPSSSPSRPMKPMPGHDPLAASPSPSSSPGRGLDALSSSLPSSHDSPHGPQGATPHVHRPGWTTSGTPGLPGAGGPVGGGHVVTTGMALPGAACGLVQPAPRVPMDPCVASPWAPARAATLHPASSPAPALQPPAPYVAAAAQGWPASATSVEAPLGAKGHGGGPVAEPYLEAEHPSSRLTRLRTYAACIADLVSQKMEAGWQHEALSLQLLCLVIWKEALTVCHDWAALPAPAAAPVLGESARGQNRAAVGRGSLGDADAAKWCDEVEEEYLTAVSAGETVAAGLKRDDHAPVPDAAEAVYQAALSLGRAGAVEELMGKTAAAENSYSRSLALLQFLQWEAPRLPLSPPLGHLSHEDKLRLQKYSSGISNRLQHCLHELRSISPEGTGMPVA